MTEQLGSLDLPSPGFGTRNIDEGHVAESVRTAIEVGYRHVDTAQNYDNEAAVGEGIAAASVPREDLFVATKILHPSIDETVDHDRTVEHARGCLERLGLDSVDLLYIHWPDDFDLETAFDAFADLHDEGVYDHLGVSNFTPELLEEARAVARDPIEVHQVEFHPLLQQEELREYCATEDIALVSYCPLMRGEVGDVPELVEIGEKHGVSPAQVSLAWIREKGAVPVPKATGEDHIRDNWASRTLELDEEDVAAIDAIDRERRLVDTDFAIW